MAGTVIRVKRFITDEPQNAFVLNHKRRKTDESETDKENDISTIFKFAGTVQNTEDDLKKVLSVKKEIEDNYKQHKIDITSKLRQENVEQTRNSRFKIVNCFRHGLNEEEEDALTVLDIEAQESKEEQGGENENYVYDVYFVAQTHDHLYAKPPQLDASCSVHPVTEDLVFEVLGENCEDSDEDSEDSNAESHWRNDYPDESDGESVDENDMIAAMNHVGLGNDLSSDDDEDDVLYENADENEAYGYYVQDDCEALKHGEKYVVFKGKNIRNFTDSDADDGTI